ncbi:MAG: hypothetical protein ACXWXJ_10175 [Aeromicrobium sp.]
MLASLPGAALAGGGGTSFFVFLGSECLEGTTNPSRTFEITVKDPNGKIKTRQFTQSDEGGFWFSCFNGRVDAGDTVKTKGTGADRSFAVPNLTIRTNRVTNEVRGTGPANSAVELVLTTCKTYNGASCSEKFKSVPTLSDGSYLTTFNGPNPRGGDNVSVSWNSDQGDFVTKDKSFENLTVVLGGFERGRFNGVTNEGKTIDLELRDGGTLRGSATVTGDDFGSFGGRFRASNAPVYPRDGDHVTGSLLAGDLNLVIPAVSLQTNVDNDRVSGRCYANQPFAIEAFGDEGFSEKRGKAGSNGSFNVDMSSGDFASYDMAPGDTVVLRCRNKQGDEILHEKTAGGALTAPEALSGTGGDISYPVRFGYSGPFNATARGLIPAETEDGTVEQGESSTFDIEIPAGTTYARFALFDEETDGFHDLDLFVSFEGNVVGQSARFDSNEQVNVVNPEAGTYGVNIFGFSVDGAEANFTLFSWAVGSSGSGNMTVNAPSTASDGDLGTIELSFSGLAAATRYLGSVRYTGTSGMPDPTIISVNTP